MLRHVLFVALLGFVMVGYLVQINIVKRIFDFPYTDGTSNSLLAKPVRLQESKNYIQQPAGGTSDDPFLLAHSVRQQKQLLRTRMTEEQVHKDLKSAFAPVAPLIQAPLGGPKPEYAASYMLDNHLRPLDANFRGINVIDNPALRAARVLYLITPTYKRTTQMVDLLRLSQTLQLAVDGGYHVRLYWIILEDHPHCTKRVRQIALDSGIPFAHVHVRSKRTKDKKYNPYGHRGVEQRNAGLQIVEQVGAEGVVYFMDDDNGYHVQLFHELPYTTHVSVFGVGLPGGSAYERCHVNPKTGQVDQLLTTWEAPRQFPMDMAGFAFATHHLARGIAAKHPIRFLMKSKSGYLENDLILQMASTLEELEPLAANCTRILTYHVKTVGNDLYRNPEPNRDAAKFNLMTALV